MAAAVRRWARVRLGAAKPASAPRTRIIITAVATECARCAARRRNRAVIKPRDPNRALRLVRRASTNRRRLKT